MKNVEIDPDIKKEYINQKKYLESSVFSLKKRLEKEQQIHREDNLNIMQENMDLIQDITDLRREVRDLNGQLKKQKNIHKEEMARLEGSLDRAADSKHNDPEGSQMLAALDKHDDQQETLHMLKREQEMKRKYIAQMQQNLQQKLTEA